MAVRTKSTGMWGLDIGDGRLRMVHLVRAGRRSRLTRALSIRVADDATDGQLSQLLRRAVDGSGVETEQIAVCLPTTAGYIRCHKADEAAPADESFVSDYWTVSDGARTLTVTAVADRRQADRLVRIAGLAGLHVAHVTLPHIAAAASLGLLNAEGGSDVRGGFVVDHGQVRFILARGGAPLLTRSTPRMDEGDSNVDLAQAAAASYRAAQMAESVPTLSELSIIADDADFATIEPMAATVGVRLRRISAGQAVGLSAPDAVPRDVSEYAVPIGAALLAAGLTDRKMDLRGALAQPEATQPLVRRRFWAALAAVILIGAVGLFAYEWIPKRVKLARLQREYAQRLPLLARRDQAQRTWQLLQPWLGPAQEGGRIEHLQILKGITELFPEASDAYVTDMTVDVPRTRDLVNINLTGRAVSSDILHACVARLDESEQFETQPVRLSDVEQALTYPKKYVIPIAMEGAGDGGQSP